MSNRWARQMTVLCAGALWAAGSSAQSRVEGDFADRWVDADATLNLRIDAATQARLWDLRVFVGRTDVSALVRSPAPGTLELSGAQLPLPAGESELVVYAVGAEQWEELARLALKVRDRGGFESSEFTPRAELQMKGRSLERHNGSGSPRGTYADIVGQGGVAWKATRAGWQFAAQANLSAVSFRGESLRFFELAERSPKVDLADYRVEAAYGEHRVELGHVSYGNHPLLLNSMASRGLVLRTRLGQRADLSLNSMNGTAVVGYDNLSGLDDAEHRINAVTLGVEMLPARPGGLRAELTLLDASVQSRSNFNRGEIPDAEQSRGVGVHVLATQRQRPPAPGRVAGPLALRQPVRPTARAGRRIAGRAARDTRRHEALNCSTTCSGSRTRCLPSMRWMSV